jgi:phosphonate transport system substrate-binding protein
MESMATVPPGSTLTFGCVPHTDDDLTRLRLVELCKWLSCELNAPVRAHRASSPGALAQAFQSGRVDIAWVSPALLIIHAGFSEAKPIVCALRQGVALYHAVLFVDEMSPYRSPSHLKGARAAWVAKSSAAGYIVPRLALASYGFDPRTLFSSEAFYDSHGNVARAVLDGLADVGATYAVFENGDPSQRMVRAGFDDVSSIKSARVLHAAGPIPSDPIVVGPRVSAAARIAIINAFVELRNAPGDAIKHVIGADAFERIHPRALDALREEIRNGRELGLLDEG